MGLVDDPALFPQRSGVLALTQVLEPYLVLSSLLAAAFLAIRGPNIARIAAATC